jgi:secretion/DNA translocation related TadE-like protein
VIGRPSDQGVAGIWLVAATAVVLAALVAAAALGAALAARQRAQNAADLAALAAAAAVVRGGDACTAADRTAAAGGAHLVRCLPDPATRTVTVGVVVPVPRGLAMVSDMPPARASARAGLPP